VKADGTPAGTAQPAYSIAITAAGSTYTIQVSWQSLVSNASKDYVILYYQQP